MTTINIQLHDNLNTLINLIKETNDAGIVLDIPEGAIILENITNLMLIKAVAEKHQKTVHFETEDEYGQNLLNMLDEKREGMITEQNTELTELVSKQKEKKKFKLPIIFSKKEKASSEPKNTKKKKFPILILLILFLLFGGLVYGGYYYVTNVPKAQIKVKVNSQPLIKSVQIKILKDSETNTEEKILKGHEVSTVIIQSNEINTTGEILVGEKAEGKIEITNKTLSDKKFDKGTEFESDDGLKYVLKDEVEVPAAVEETVEEETDEGVVINTSRTYGTKETEIEAVEIGSDYNLDKEEDIKFDDFDEDDYSAKLIEDIDGGESETKSVVTQEDLDKLSTEITEQVNETLQQSLENANNRNYTLISGSENITVVNEVYSAELSEETDTIELTKTFNISSLAYSKNELDNLIENILEEFVPEGYELYTSEINTDVQVLGNTETTTLSTTETDLQATIRTSVIVEINTENIKNQLVGVDIKEAQKTLSSIQNIETYEMELNPNISFLQKMPRKIDNINIEIERQ